MCTCDVVVLCLSGTLGKGTLRTHPWGRVPTALIAGPCGLAVLDVLFLPYDKGDSRECTYYKRRASPKDENNGGNNKCSNGRQQTVMAPCCNRAH
jgi:hypothetical protein